MHLNPVYQYDNDKDTMPIYPMVLPCILLGIFIHGNFNRNAMSRRALVLTVTPGSIQVLRHTVQILHLQGWLFNLGCSSG